MISSIDFDDVAALSLAEPSWSVERRDRGAGPVADCEAPFSLIRLGFSEPIKGDVIVQFVVKYVMYSNERN
jgi:hypothetical protein